MGSHMAKRITMTKPSAPPTTTLAWEEMPEAEKPTMAEAEIVVQKSRHVVREVRTLISLRAMAT